MSHADATDVESLAAQAQSFPPLTEGRVEQLFAAIRGGDGRAPLQELVEHHLALVLEEAQARAERGVEVFDLYQEGTLAALVAISEYARRGGRPSGLRTFVARVVGSHMDDTLAAETIEQESEAAFVRDAERYERVELGLRLDLGHGPTPTELAGLLGWPAERVEMIGEMLAEARAMHDGEIVDYLDDT